MKKAAQAPGQKSLFQFFNKDATTKDDKSAPRQQPEEILERQAPPNVAAPLPADLPAPVASPRPVQPIAIDAIKQEPDPHWENPQAFAPPEEAILDSVEGAAAAPVPRPTAALLMARIGRLRCQAGATYGSDSAPHTGGQTPADRTGVAGPSSPRRGAAARRGAAVKPEREEEERPGPTPGVDQAAAGAALSPVSPDSDSPPRDSQLLGTAMGVDSQPSAQAEPPGPAAAAAPRGARRSGRTTRASAAPAPGPSDAGAAMDTGEGGGMADVVVVSEEEEKPTPGRGGRKGREPSRARGTRKGGQAAAAASDAAGPSTGPAAAAAAAALMPAPDADMEEAEPQPPQLAPPAQAKDSEPGSSSGPDSDEDEEGDGLTEYERRRLAIIARNRLVMAQVLGDALPPPEGGLGKRSSGPSGGPPSKKKKAGPRPPPLPEYELRRSGRRRAQPGSMNEEALFQEAQRLGAAAAAAAGAAGSDDDAEAPEPEYDDSSVLRYVCGGEGDAGGAAAPSGDDLGLGLGSGFGPAGGEGPGSDAGGAAAGKGKGQLSGYRLLPSSFFDSAQNRSYALDSDGKLVVTGGKEGKFACYAVADLAARCRAPSGRSDSAQDGNVQPLISAKLTKNWIADLRLMQGAGTGPGQLGAGSAVVMLSAANDGKVCVWNLAKKVKVAGGSTTPAPLNAGLQIHANGIFSLDTCGPDAILTTSKDGSAKLSRMRPETSELSVVHTFEDIHNGGVVKSGRFRDAMTAATVGNDHGVCVLDVRAAGVAQRIENAHGHVTNYAEWCPSDPNLLLSTALDPVIKVWDLRKTSDPVWSFNGHIVGGGKINMYRGIFVNGGKHIACPGEGSNRLSLYRLSDGKTVSRGYLGFDPSMLWARGAREDGSLLLAGGKAVHVAVPSFTT